MPKEPIRMYGTNWCPQSSRARKFLLLNGIPFLWFDIDKDAKACAYVEQVNNGMRRVPTVVF
ncbi:MAG: glutaredoxin domain-containing protein, partial [Dehalococcoidales bacterium]|nr:glutaredoxin domain-containing protein [Dehalococcoidales bacterium]